MTIDEKTGRDLDHLLAGGDSIDGLYEELRSSFDAEKSAIGSEGSTRRFATVGPAARTAC